MNTTRLSAAYSGLQRRLVSSSFIFSLPRGRSYESKRLIPLEPSLQCIRPPAARGFTLIETIITLAVIGLVIGVLVPALSNLAIAELHSTSRKVAGFIRDSYDSAALSGQTYRMVFDPAGKKVSSEATEQVLNFNSETNALVEAVKEGDTVKNSAFEDLVGDLEAYDLEAADAAEDETAGGGNLLGAMFGGINSLASTGALGGAESFKEAGKALPLDKVYLADLTIAGKKQDEPKNKTYLYFFPHGYTQDAIIHLATGSGADVVYVTIRIEALTGAVRIDPGYIEDDE